MSDLNRACDKKTFCETASVAKCCVPHFRLACAQISTKARDVPGNIEKIVDYAQKAREAGASLLVVSQSAVEGCPLRKDDRRRPMDCDWMVASLKKRLKQSCPEIFVAVSLPGCGDAGNSLIPSLWVLKGEEFCQSFSLGNAPMGAAVVSLLGEKIGFFVKSHAKEDAPDCCRQDHNEKMSFLVVLASDAVNGEFLENSTARNFVDRQCPAGQPIVYLNNVGGYDDLVCLGESCVFDAQGVMTLRAKGLKNDFFVVDTNELYQPHEPKPCGPLNPYERMYDVLVYAVREYVTKSGFSDVVLGLSGGVDSALVATIAVDALGAEHVHALGLATQFTSQESLDLAQELADNLGIDYRVRNIDTLFESFVSFLSPDFEGRAWDETEENLQARIRGMILMSFANKFRYLVLATSNKSEAAVGYCTLFGDTAGAYSPIKDVYKTDVWEICRHVNKKAGYERIPEHIVTRAPSAELREGQKDSDSLPDYEVLDRILQDYVEKEIPIGQMIERGACGHYGGDSNVVERVINLIARNEFKRRLSPLGPKMSRKTFGVDWIEPVATSLKAQYFRDPE